MQGSAVQRIGAGDSDSTQPQAIAAAAPDAVQQKHNKHSRTQLVQQADIPAGDVRLGAAEVGPQATTSVLQQSAASWDTEGKGGL